VFFDYCSTHPYLSPLFLAILTHNFQISLHLLVSILLYNLASSSNPSSKPSATIVDTTGSFPVSLLAKVLRARIISSRAASTTAAVQTANYDISGQSLAVTDEEVEKGVQRCLEMVAISRVFDIEGLWEVLGEVGRDGTSHDDSDTPVSTHDPKTTERSPQRPTEIADSEAELTPEAATPLPPSQNKTEQDPGIEIIIIDNITHLITSLLARKEKSEAHDFLTLLSLTLHTLTHTRNILTLLHNSTVPTKSSASTSNYAYRTTTSNLTTSRNQNHQSRQPQIPTSIFPSNTTKPALGQIFTQFPELHLFISKLPKGKGDAEILYGHDEDSVSVLQGSGNVKYCFVVEVLKDETPNLGMQGERDKGEGKGLDREDGKGKKFGWREQRWTAVDVTADGTGFEGAFQVKGNMRGMELERERIGGLTDVGNVAKIYGFGGRRV
jgi:hypothetical protein